MSTDALKLTAYFGERDRTGGAFSADALLDLFGRRRAPISLLLRGTSGFGLRHHLRTDRVLTLSEDLPLAAVAVDTRQRIEALAPEARELLPAGLVTMERAQLLLSEPPGPVEPGVPEGTVKLTVYVGRGQRAGGRAAYLSICDLLHRRGVAGATVLLGVDGTVHGRRNRAGFFGSNAEVPMMIIAVGDGPVVARALPELRALLQRPLMTLERVTVCKRDGELLARPTAAPETDVDGVPLWQKLMVFSSEHARAAGTAQHAALMERLRSGAARGAITLRGVWGFHGDHVPHGDRLLQLGRHVPVVTIAVDRPAELARSFEIVDELTAERGLVTTEIVPALTPADGSDGLRLARPPR